MKKLLATVLLTAALAVPAHAEEARPIDLDTAIATALRQNDTVLAEATDVDVATAQVIALEGADDLVIEGEVGGLLRETEPVEGPFFQETALDHLTASVGIWKPLSSGGRVGLTMRDDISRAGSRIDTGAPGAMPFDLDYTVHAPRAEVVLVQPLLRGRGKQSAHAARRTAAAQRDAEAAERGRAEAVLIHDVTVTYWQLAYASREIAIHESALALARQQLEVTQARQGVGKGSELEVLAVEQAIASREAALLAARQAETERALELKVLLADESDDRPLAAADPLEGGAATHPETEAALAQAIAFSPDLHVLAEHARAAAVERDAANQELAPRLDLVLRGGPAGNSDQAGDAFAQMATFDSYSASAFVSFSIPLGNRSAKGRYAAARLREKRLGHAAEEVRGELTAAVQRATDAIDLGAKRVEAAQKAADLARRTVELEEARWQSGAGTNFDVMERQDQLAAADAALARAQADLRIAAAGLAYLTGDR